MHRTIAQLHLGAEIEPVKDGTPTDFDRSAGKKKNIWDRPWKSEKLHVTEKYNSCEPVTSSLSLSLIILFLLILIKRVIYKRVIQYNYLTNTFIFLFWIVWTSYISSDSYIINYITLVLYNSIIHTVHTVI